jgi:hypothetical protein
MAKESNPLSISFDVTARLEALDAAMKRAEAMARDGGQRMAAAQADGMAGAGDLTDRIPKVFGVAGQNAAEEFGKGFERANPTSKIGRQLESGLKKFIAITFVDTIIRGIAEAVEKDLSLFDTGMLIGQRVLDGIKSVPIVGAIGELGSAIGNRITVEGGFVDEMMGTTPTGNRRGMAGEFAQGSNILAAMDAETQRLGDDLLSADQIRRREFEKSIEDFKAKAAAASVSGDDINAAIRNRREAFEAREQRMIEAARARREVEEYRASEEEWKRGREFQRQQLEEQRQADNKRQRETMAAEIAARREMVGTVGDEMKILSGVTASQFVETRDTAIGGFRFAQENADRILADNSVKLLELTKKQTDLLQEIKNLQSESVALQ